MLGNVVLIVLALLLWQLNTCNDVLKTMLSKLFLSMVMVTLYTLMVVGLRELSFVWIFLMSVKFDRKRVVTLLSVAYTALLAYALGRTWFGSLSLIVGCLSFIAAVVLLVKRGKVYGD